MVGNERIWSDLWVWTQTEVVEIGTIRSHFLNKTTFTESKCDCYYGPDQEDLDKKSEGAIGFSLGGGFEFPIKMKESYIGVEALWHTVNFFDKYTNVYQEKNDGTRFFSEIFLPVRDRPALISAPPPHTPRSPNSALTTTNP